MIVADSSSMISLGMNCMSQVLNSLGVHITVTPAIYDEIVTRPMGSKRYALEAIRIKKLFSEGVLSVEEADRSTTDSILKAANSIFGIRKKSLKIIHRGEAEALALIKGIGADAFLIDERTTRLLMEDPEGLRKLLGYRTRKDVKINQNMLESFRGIAPSVPIIRSVEIAARAYETGILGGQLCGDKDKILEAVLCALKFAGCAISWSEIEEYKRILS